MARARYEFSEGTSNKFWEIEKNGPTSFTTYWGKIGQPPTFAKKKFDDEETANKEHDKLVREKTKKGYEPVGAAAADGGEEEDEAEAAPKAKKTAAKAKAVKGGGDFEKKIEADPDDVKAYLVYADQLQEAGDPRGELIAIHAKLAESRPEKGRDQTSADKDKVKELKKAADALIKKNAEHFLGSLHEADHLEVEWHLGFIKKAHLKNDGFEGEGETVVAELETLLNLPSSRFIQDLTIGPVPGDDMMSLSPLVEVLEKKKTIATLRSLNIGDCGDWDISSCEGMDFDKLVKFYPKLRSLTLHGGSLGIGKIDQPELVEFRAETGGLTEDNIKDIVKAKWPNLEHLELWFGDEERGASGDLNSIRGILAGIGLKKLKFLGLKNCSWADEICRALPKATIISQIEVLDLSMGEMTIAGAKALAELGKTPFKKLKKLIVEKNYLSDAAKAILKPLAPELEFGKQKGDENEEYRYVSVSE